MRRPDGCTCERRASEDGSHLPGCPVVPMVRPNTDPLEEARWRHYGVPEMALDDPEGMCANCVTPWKCNGPHEPTCHPTGHTVCHQDGDPWPCDFVVATKALSEAAAAEREKYRFGWCCDFDFDNGTYRTTDCISRTRNADVVESEAAAAGARAERERLRAEVRESGRVGVAIEGQISPAMRSAYSEGFHRGIREALEVLAEPEDA